MVDGQRSGGYPAAMPLFSSFDDAWRWFEAGGELVPLDEQRERFTRGRAQLLVFQAPMSALPVLDLAHQVLDELAGVEALLPLPDDVLHCSIRGAGFQVIAKRRPDDVLREEVGAVAARADGALGAFAPVEVEVGPVGVFPDALILEVHDGGVLKPMRDALAESVGADPFALAHDQYLPHVSLAFFADASCGDALRELLPAIRGRPAVRVPVRRIDFVRWWLTGEDLEQPPELDVVRSYRLRG